MLTDWERSLDRWKRGFLSVLIGFVAYTPFLAEAETMSELECEIQQTLRGNAIDIFGVVRSDRPATGSYGFIVNKSGPSGMSRVIQKGLFSAKPEEENIVGNVTLSANDGDRYLIRLTVTDDATGKSCSVTRE